jgi:O-antigen ligase
VVVLSLVLFGICVLVDVRAEAAFDAPKRLVTLVGVVVAVVALLLPAQRKPSDTGWSWRRGTREQRLALVVAGGGLALALISALLSPRRMASLDATRTLFLFALLLPLGASRALDGQRSRILAGAFVGGGIVNAAVSLLQFSGTLRLFRVEAVGGRLDVSAFVGNDGVLALALALTSLGCLAAVLATRSAAIRFAGSCGIVLQLAALAVNQSLTALTALATGAVALGALSGRRRALLAVPAIVVVLTSGVMVHPTLSRRAHAVLVSIRAGDWDRSLSYRLGPWAAAVEMIRTRPLDGWGPGTFGAEFVAHRLRAELRFHRRFVNPFLAGSYTEAHSEYLQAAAEAGVGGALAGLIAFGILLVGLLRSLRGAPDGRTRREAIVVFAVLCAGGVSALTWFPLQRPITAVPLLLAAGRAWRLSGRANLGGAA